MESKAQLRKRMKAERNALSEAERQTYSMQICDRLCEQSWYAKADAILVYSAIQSEADLDLFCKKAWADEKKLYFPKVFGEKMDFFCVSDASQLTSGAFHVMEPDVDTYVLETFQSTQVQVPILVPGVAFSRRGERIGYGKGYYDRYIGIHSELLSVGICFECQLLDVLPAEPQDIAMCQIVTELNKYKVRD